MVNIYIPCDYDKSKITDTSGIKADLTPNSNKFSVDIRDENRNYVTRTGTINYLHSSAYDTENKKVICSKCGVDITSTEPHEHDMAEANCTYYPYCKICGYVDINNLEKNSNVHNWVIDQTTGYPKCTLCGKEITETPSSTTKTVKLIRKTSDFKYDSGVTDGFEGNS